MRTVGNIIIILFVLVTVYALREDLRPLALRLGGYAQKIQESLTRDSSTQKDLLQEIPTSKVGDIVEEIVTPGPLTESDFQTRPQNVRGSISKADIIYWTNQARKENGNLKPLIENQTLNNTALVKTEDMFTKQYFEHTSPSGVTIGDQAKDAGYDYIVIGENLALGSFSGGQSIVNAWMQSPGHRANILNTHYNEIGIGIKKGTYEGREVWIAVQHFGLPKSVCPAVDQKLRAQIDINESRIGILKNQVESKKAEVDNTSENYTFEYNRLIEEYNTLVRQFNDLVSTTREIIVLFNDQVKAYNACVQRE